jgi:hypothetical protein
MLLYGRFRARTPKIVFNSIDPKQTLSDLLRRADLISFLRTLSNSPRALP